MTRKDKSLVIEELRETLGTTPYFYVTDSSTLTVAQVNKLRRMCFEKGVRMKVAKNTLIRKALEALAADGRRDYSPLYESLHGPTTLFISDNPKAPAQIIEEFRKNSDRPILKAAYIDASVFIGDDQLKTLTQLKSKEELISEILGLLTSPARSLAAAIASSGNKVAGAIKALADREG
ncbi:MAG: 50S ribosomal protein L10 [Saprospiraceae bacterium]|nr:50S ribosomal protein L10 [Saprospiraceae bacterium]MDW8482831.1 50S ribosomal protein L10 [Saprospiraceae bacterium]